MDATDTSFPVMSLNTFNNATYQEERKRARQRQLAQMEQAFATASMVQDDDESVASMHSAPDRKSSIRRALGKERNLAPRSNSGAIESEEELHNEDLMEELDTNGQAKKERESKRHSLSDCCVGCFYTAVGLVFLGAEVVVAFWGARKRRQKIALVLGLVSIPLLIMTIALATMGGGGTNDEVFVNGRNVVIPPIDTDPINTARYQELRSSIIDYGVTSQGVIDAQGTAQNLALRWITDYDAANLKTDDDSILERYALAVFFFSTFVMTNETHLINHAGTKFEWINSDYWMSEKGICAWYGIRCPLMIRGGQEVDQYNENAAVLSLNLTANNVKGTIPSEIAALENLDLIELADNSLEGTIPESIGLLYEMDNIYLMDNQLTGTIPESLGDLTAMQNFHVGNNELQGPIPLGFSDFRKLESLGLDQNHFTGILPDFSKLEELRILYLDKNDFTGTIPLSYGALPAMTDLRLADNYLTGTIPTEIFNLDRLELLYLDDNDLTGTVPDLFGQTTRLKEIQLYKNKLTGPLPMSIAQANVLRVLYMDSNQFSGTIPSVYGNLDDLVTFFVYNNKLSGTIPSQVGNMKDLKDFRVYQNHLTGTIPEEIGSAFNLEVVYIQDNNLSGTVPNSIGNLDHLRSFRFYRNELEGEVSKDICQLTEQYNLEFIAGDCDRDTGSIRCDCCHECY